jgi:hypothetical protein
MMGVQGAGLNSFQQVVNLKTILALFLSAQRRACKTFSYGRSQQGERKPNSSLARVLAVKRRPYENVVKRQKPIDPSRECGVACKLCCAQ